MTRANSVDRFNRSFDNPFCTRRVRPGAMPFHFPAGDSAEQLLERLRENRWRGAILGPHGGGKSTLLATLEPLLAERGRDVRRVTLRDGQRSLPANFARRATLNENSLIIVDGYEQLGFLARLFLKWRCVERGAGLLVTAHEPVGLPEVFRTRPSLELAQQLTGELLTDGEERVPIAEADVAAAFTRHRENLRETLFALYDLYEERKSGQRH